MRNFAILCLLLMPQMTVAQPQTERIVALGGSVTEILYALNMDERVVAVDSTSLYPPAALQEKPNVGYLRQLSAEGVLSLEPALIVAEDDVGPPETVAVLQGAGIPFLIAPEARDGESLAEKIRFVGEAVGAGEAAQRLASNAEAELARIESVVATAPEQPPVIFLLSIEGGRLLAAGAETSADAMIALAGGRNALSGFTGYKPITPEALLTSSPDIIVMMDRGEGHVATLEQIRAIPALAATPAAQHGRLVTMDGLLLLGFGPRTAEAVSALARAFHPSLDFSVPSADPFPQP